MSEAFRGCVFSFDENATRIYGEIAAIAKSQAAVIATRNTKDFAGYGIEIINPRK